MPWGYVVAAVILYFIFQKKIKQIKAWIDRHEELIEKWKDNEDIMKAYNALIEAVKVANFDRKWTVLEIITVLSLAIKLFQLIKKFEEEGEDNA